MNRMQYEEYLESEHWHWRRERVPTGSGSLRAVRQCSC